MSTILLVEDAPDLGLYEVGLLEQDGHHVFRCCGGPVLHGACPLLRGGDCALPAVADLIVFSVPLFGPLRNRTYRGIDLLRAYRGHRVYGRLPMLIVSVGDPGAVEGIGPLEVIDKFGEPNRVRDAVRRMLSAAWRAARPSGPAAT